MIEDCKAMDSSIPLLKLKLGKIQNLDRQVSKLGVSSDAKSLVIISSDTDKRVTEVLILDHLLELKESPPLNTAIYPFDSVSIDTTGRYIAKVREFEIIDLKTGKIQRPELPYPVSGCWFDQKGRCWLYGSDRNYENLFLQIYNRTPWRRLATTSFSGFYGGCTRWFAASTANQVCFLDTDGQSGIEIFWAELDHEMKLSVRKLESLDMTCEYVPIVSETGGEIIALNQYGDDELEKAPGVVRLLKPFEEFAGRVTLPEFDSKEFNDERPEEGVYLDLVHVLVRTFSDRFYVIHTRSMEIIYEVLFENVAGSWESDIWQPLGMEVCGENLVIFLYKYPRSSGPVHMASLPLKDLLPT